MWITPHIPTIPLPKINRVPTTVVALSGNSFLLSPTYSRILYSYKCIGLVNPFKTITYIIPSILKDIPLHPLKID